MNSFLISLLSALVATNEPSAVSNLIANTTGVSVNQPDHNDPAEKEYQKLLDDDDTAQTEADKWIRENRVFDEKGGEIKVEKNQGVMIPKGAYYRYLNTGSENLVVLRVGSGVKGQKQGGEEMRVRPDGKPLVASSEENKTVPPIEDSRFFADTAG